MNVILPKWLMLHSLFAVAVLFLTMTLPSRAERGVVLVQVHDVRGRRPVSGLEISVDGYGGTGRTGNDGKARLPLGSAAAAGDWITVTVLHSPKGKDLVLVSPWDRKVQIPSFQDKPGNYVDLFVTTRGNRSALENGILLSAATANINNINSRSVTNNRPEPPDPNAALAIVAKEYGYSPEDLDRAIRAWGEKATDSYASGMVALYERNFASASIQLQNSLTLRERELAAARSEAATQEANVANAALFLGSSLYAQGKYKDAANAFRKYLEVRPNDPFVIDRVATSLQQANEYEAAESLTDEALAIARKRYGPNNPALASALDSAGDAAEAIGNHSRAESLIQQAVDIERAAQAGGNNPLLSGNNLAASLNDLGMVHQSQQKFTEAEHDYEEAISINESLFGPNNLEGASYRNNLATLYQDLHEYGKAEQEVLGVLALRQSMQGQDHPQVATGFRILSEVYLSQGRATEAETYARQALETDENFFGENSPQVGRDLQVIVGALLLQRKYQDAEKYSDRAANVWRAVDGPQSHAFGEALRMLGNVYWHLGKYAEAEQQTRRSLEIFQKNLPPDYHLLALTWEQLARIYRDEHKCSEAGAALKNALSIALRRLGPDHRTTKNIQADSNAPAC